MTHNEEENYVPKIKEGSITKRRDGRWMGRYYDDGIQKSVYSHTKLEIIAKLNECIQLRNQKDKLINQGID